MENAMTGLAVLAKAGDVDAFGKLYEMYAGELYRYACCVLGSASYASDAVQDAACSAFSQIRNLRDEKAFKIWFFKILSNCCKKYFSDLKRERLTEELHEIAEESLELAPSDPVLSHELASALSKLGSEERQIVFLCVIAGYNSREIAGVLDLPSATVRSKLARALKKLRTELEP